MGAVRRLGLCLLLAACGSSEASPSVDREPHVRLNDLGRVAHERQRRIAEEDQDPRERLIGVWSVEKGWLPWKG